MIMKNVRNPQWIGNAYRLLVTILGSTCISHLIVLECIQAEQNKNTEKSTGINRKEFPVILDLMEKRLKKAKNDITERNKGMESQLKKLEEYREKLKSILHLKLKDTLHSESKHLTSTSPRRAPNDKRYTEIATGGTTPHPQTTTRKTSTNRIENTNKKIPIQPIPGDSQQNNYTGKTIHTTLPSATHNQRTAKTTHRTVPDPNPGTPPFSRKTPVDPTGGSTPSPILPNHPYDPYGKKIIHTNTTGNHQSPPSPTNGNYPTGAPSSMTTPDHHPIPFPKPSQEHLKGGHNTSPPLIPPDQERNSITGKDVPHTTPPFIHSYPIAFLSSTDHNLDKTTPNPLSYYHYKTVPPDPPINSIESITSSPDQLPGKITRKMASTNSPLDQQQQTTPISAKNAEEKGKPMQNSHRPLLLPNLGNTYGQSIVITLWAILAGFFSLFSIKRYKQH